METQYLITFILLLFTVQRSEQQGMFMCCVVASINACNTIIQKPWMNIEQASKATIYILSFMCVVMCTEAMAKISVEC